MSKTGLLNQSGAKTFQKDGKLGQLLPIGFHALGIGCMGMALATAFAPPSVAFLAKTAGMLDKVGLDKGPLLMFGVLSTAMGFALSRLNKASTGGGAAMNAASFAQANASSIETQAEVLGSVQSELTTIRQELSTARIKADEAKNAEAEGNGEGSDPIFRLAASLDQLGAQIDKRIDKARRELIEAVSGIASTAEVSAQQREDAFKKSASDVDSVRMDIADLRAQLTRVATDVNSTKSAVAALESPSAAETSAPVQAAVSSKPSLPVELTDNASASEEKPAESSAPQPEKSAEPQFEGFKFEEEEKAPEGQPEVNAESPSLGVNMQSLGFPEPPAPIPKPSQDLGLIDQMQENTANKADETPPLFPDAFDQN